MSVVGSMQAMGPRRLVAHVSARKIAGCLGAFAVAATALVSSLIGAFSASAAACPDVEVLFARGTTEPPGVGETGQAFVDALSSRIRGRSLGVYAIDYPASLDFPTAADGVIDAGNHVRSMAASCPNTQMVLGGYSQGAAVIGYLTADAIPAGYIPPTGITGPLPPEVANHVTAVALFGKPSNEFLDMFGAPPIAVGGRFAAKTIDLCVPDDPICSLNGNDNGAHTLHALNGMEAQAATSLRVASAKTGNSPESVTTCIGEVRHY